jgi:nitrogen fixation protein FixH
MQSAQTSQETNQKLEKRGRIWPWLLAGLLFASVSKNLVMAYIAISDPSFSVEKDYYNKGLAWDQEMAQRRENQRLGWSIDLNIKLSTTKPLAARTQIILWDRNKQRIDKAIVRAEVFHNARAQWPIQVTFAAQDNHYAATLPLNRPGLWIFRFTIWHEEQRFTHTIRKDL